ncbi:lysoplasmalogenase [Escherichia coli]|nr:lysoplasmalogenase [Escherichia coli]
MLWSFIAVCLSAWLSVDASYRGPTWQRWVFKPLTLLLLLLLAIIWTRLEEYRWPICTFIGMTLVMVWLAGELWFFRPTAPALSAFVGASLLFISNFVWLGSHYRRRFRADNAIAAACYFAGHFLIVRSLYL